MGLLELLLPGVSETQDKIRRNFERLERLFSLASKDSDGFGFTVAGVRVRFGVTTLTFTASVNSAAKTVTHGLGKTPVVVQAMALNASYGNVPNPLANTLNATTFDLLGEVKTSLTGSVSMMWIAVG